MTRAVDDKPKRAAEARALLDHPGSEEPLAETSERVDRGVAGSPRYRCVDDTAYYAGNELQLFESPVTDVRQVLPAVSTPLLKACDRFRTLDENAAIICLAEPFREVPVAAIRELLVGLVSAGLAGLLVSPRTWPRMSVGELAGRSAEAARGKLQRFLRDFGALLSAWPGLVEGARELRDRGCRPARRL
jgi:hypothetical protein